MLEEDVPICEGVEMRKLNAKHELFVRAYLGPSKGNAADAARRAGYSASSKHALAVVGQRLLTNVDIAQKVASAQKATERESIATIVEIHETLTELMRTTSVSPADRIKAGVELSKMRGQYAPERVEHKIETTAIFVYPVNGRVPDPE